MALKRISAPVAAAKPAAKNQRPVITVTGNAVDSYVKSSAALKKAKADKDQAEVAVFEAGIKRVIETNLANPGNPVSSVDVVDSTGATAMVTLKDQYGAVDADAVSAVFEEQLPGLDINQFVHEVVTAKFDSSVFMVNNEFSEERYNAFKAAIDQVAAQFNVPSPLSSGKKVTAKPNFHAARWTAIKSVESQLAIQQVLPATVAGKSICEGTVEAK